MTSERLLRVFLLASGAILFIGFIYYLVLLPNEGDGLFFGFSPQRLFLIGLLGGLGFVSGWIVFSPGGKLRSLKWLETTEGSQRILWAQQGVSAVVGLSLLFLLSLPADMFGSRIYVLERLQIAMLAFAICFWLYLIVLFIIIFRSSSQVATNQSLVLIFGMYCTVRSRQVLFIREMATSPDSIDYLGGDTLAYVLSESLWIGARPFSLPLLNTLLSNNLAAFGWLQSMLSILAWGFLVYAVIQWLKNPFTRFVTGIVLFGLSLSSQLLIWDWVLLAESLSNSLMVVMAALLLLLLRNWRWEIAIPFLLVAVLWANTRDLNVWILLGVSILLGVYGLSKRQYRRYLIFPVVFLAIFLFNSYSVNQTMRWRISYINVMVLRILPNEDKLDFLESRGLPVTDNLLQWTGKVDYSEAREMVTDPLLKSFWQWVDTHGRSAFAQMLVAQFPRSMLEPFEDIDFPLETDFIWYKAPGFQPLLPGWLDAITQLSLVDTWFAVFVVIVVSVGSWLVWRERPVLMIFGLGLMVLALFQNVLAWHVDAITVQRHLVGASLQFRIGLIMSITYLVDRGISRIRIQQNAAD